MRTVARSGYVIRCLCWYNSALGVVLVRLVMCVAGPPPRKIMPLIVPCVRWRCEVNSLLVQQGTWFLSRGMKPKAQHFAAGSLMSEISPVRLPGWTLIQGQAVESGSPVIYMFRSGNQVRMCWQLSQEVVRVHNKNNPHKRVLAVSLVLFCSVIDTNVKFCHQESVPRCLSAVAFLFSSSFRVWPASSDRTSRRRQRVWILFSLNANHEEFFLFSLFSHFILCFQIYDSVMAEQKNKNKTKKNHQTTFIRQMKGIVLLLWFLRDSVIECAALRPCSDSLCVFMSLQNKGGSQLTGNSSGILFFSISKRQH